MHLFRGWVGIDDVRAGGHRVVQELFYLFRWMLQVFVQCHYPIAGSVQDTRNRCRMLPVIPRKVQRHDPIELVPKLVDQLWRAIDGRVINQDKLV